MRTSIRTAVGGAAVGILALAGLALGVAPASAAIQPSTCSDDSLDGRTIVTSTNVWWDVCLEDGTTSDAVTAHKSDAFDTVGLLYVNYDTPAPIEILPDQPPVFEEVGGDELRISFVDFDVLWADGDLVDIYVEKQVKGSTQSWFFTILDSDDGTPRSDVRIDFRGNVGHDSLSTYDFEGSSMVAYGDDDDPVTIFQPHGGPGTGVGYDASDPDKIYAYAVGSNSSVDVALVDYACNNLQDAIDYAVELAGADLGPLYGQTLTTPGTVGCLTAVSPIYLAPGAAYDVPIEVTFGDAFDFSTQGGDISGYYDNLEYDGDDFVQFDQIGGGEPGVTPALRISGTTPNELGTYFIVVRGTSYANGVSDQALVQVIIGTPPAQLAATGSDVSPMLAGAGAGLLLAGVASIVLVRRRREV